MKQLLKLNINSLFQYARILLQYISLSNNFYLQQLQLLLYQVFQNLKFDILKILSFKNSQRQSTGPQNQSRMIFFSHKIKFKKQSESLGLNLNDKYIRKSKQELIQLTQKHLHIDQTLKKKKIEFELQKNQLIAEHQFLLKEQKRHKLKILKLEVRKNQLRAKQNPKITLEKAQILKKYLKCMSYTIGDKYQIIKLLGNFTTYEFIKTKVLNLELRLYLKEKMKQVVFMKKIDFEDEKVMLIIKQKQSTPAKLIGDAEYTSNKSKTVKSIANPSKFNPVSSGQLTVKKNYEVKIFAITGKAFQFSKIYSQGQLTYFIQKLSNQKKSMNLDTFTNFKGPLLQENRKPRLSLQFNSVFKKSLQGFFFKRTSLTTNQLQNKLINIDEWVRENRNSQVNKVDSDRSRTQNNKSMAQNSQQRSQLNETVLSKVSQSQHSKDSLNQQDFQDKDKLTKKTNPDNDQVSGNNNPNNLFVTFRQDNQAQSCQKPKQIQPFDPYNYHSSNNEDSQLSNHTSKIHSVSTASGFLRSFIFGQKILFPDSNPLFNLVILKKKGTFYFLPQYLNQKQNYNLVNLCVKKYQLKIKLQKQVRKCLLYKIIKVENFFETENNCMEPFSLQLLFSVKYAKHDLYIPKINEVKENIKLGKQYQGHINLKIRKSDVFQSIGRQIKGFNDDDIVISCENIRCENPDKTFLIHHILKQEVFSDLNNRVFNMLNNVNTVNSRMKGRMQHLETKKKQSDSKQKQNQRIKDDRRKNRRKKLSKQTGNNVEQLKQQEDRKQYYFREQIQQSFDVFINNNLLSIREYKFMKKINFTEHIDKIILIQKNLKCFYYKKLYKEKKKNRKFQMIFKFQPVTKILITAIFKTKEQNISIFTQCLVLRLNQKYKSYPLVYPERYWGTICTSLNNLVRLSDSVVEVKDQLEKYLQRKIKVFQQQQTRLQALKPQLYLNRLRRFFINIMLRVKAKKNIIYLKKIFHNSQPYVLIIRKSQILKNICQANLYHLQQFIEKQQNKQNLKQVSQQQFQASQQQKTTKTIQKLQRHSKNKSRYQTISLNINYFADIPKDKIQDQFYFDSLHFLLKPPRNHSLYYIERLLMIDINSEEIAKQVAMIQWKQPSKKKKNGEENTFIKLQSQAHSNLLSSSRQQNIQNNANSRIRNALQAQQGQQRLRLKRKNASIMIPDERKDIQKVILGTVNQRKNQERKSFRISERSNCILNLKDEKQRKKSRNSSKLYVGHQINVENQSKSKLSSGQRISRSSLYDLFSTNKKTQYEIKNNGHGKLLYYSLVKVEQIFFELHIYIIKRKFIIVNSQFDQQLTEKPDKVVKKGQKISISQEIKNHSLGEKIRHLCEEQSTIQNQEEFIKKKAFCDELVLVHRQNLQKKQLLEANWTFVYNKIARWIKNNQSLLLLVQQNNKI